MFRVLQPTCSGQTSNTVRLIFFTLSNLTLAYRARNVRAQGPITVQLATL